MKKSSRYGRVEMQIVEERSPHTDNGEERVAELLEQIGKRFRSRVRDDPEAWSVRYEGVLYHHESGKGFRPDFLVEFSGIRVHIELCDSESVWGNHKRQRMRWLEAGEGIPVLYINRDMLRVLRGSSGMGVLWCWLHFVATKPERTYGQIISPTWLLMMVGVHQHTNHQLRLREKRAFHMLERGLIDKAFAELEKVDSARFMFRKLATAA